MGFVNGAIDVVLLLLILVALVVIHEFGHFVVARRAGVRVHEFGIGFPPRARILGRDKETVYTLNWLPIGGFVRLEGEEGDSDDPRSFVRQPVGTRLLILLAGVAMNIVLAFLIFWFIAAFADPSSGVRIASVEPGSPAAEVGLQGGRQVGTDDEGRTLYDDTGDLITHVNGQVASWFDAPDGLLQQLRSSAGQQVTLTVQRAQGGTEQLTTRLRRPTGPEQGALGITAHSFVPGEVLSRDPITGIGVGLRRTVDASTLILRGLQELVTNIMNPPVMGPVGIVGAVGVVRAELPPVVLLWLIGLLSANLAVVNALPFPPMDGGRVAVTLLQALSGNRISEAAERLVYLTGFILLMALLVWITYFDIQRLGAT